MLAIGGRLIGYWGWYVRLAVAPCSPAPRSCGELNVAPKGHATGAPRAYCPEVISPGEARAWEWASISGSELLRGDSVLLGSGRSLFAMLLFNKLGQSAAKDCARAVLLKLVN